MENNGSVNDIVIGLLPSIRDNFLHVLLTKTVREHAFPWVIIEDWTQEIHDFHDAIVMKFQHYETAAKFICLSEAYSKDREVLYDICPNERDDLLEKILFQLTLEHELPWSISSDQHAVHDANGLLVVRFSSANDAKSFNDFVCNLQIAYEMEMLKLKKDLDLED